MRNLEAKFRLADAEAARAIALGLGYAVEASFSQYDTFFAAANGKLKLREQPPHAWLIDYQRGADGRDGLMLSQYGIVPVTDAARTREVLARSLGVLGEVRKRRTLLVRGDVRLHLDHVEELGSFGEIEAVLGDRDGADLTDAASRARTDVDELLDALGVGRAALINVSYFELKTRASETAALARH